MKLEFGYLKLEWLAPKTGLSFYIKGLCCLEDVSPQGVVSD